MYPIINQSKEVEPDNALQFLFTLLIVALTGNMISLAIGGNPSIVNFDMFVGIFSFLTLFYAILVAFREDFSGHPALPSLLDGLNVFFFFCAGIATAAYLQTGSCTDAVSLS